MAQDMQNILATDLDGTFLPLDHIPENRQDLQTLLSGLERQRVPLVYVTGRYLASVERVLEQYQLPRPDWLICDVGTSIYQQDASGQLQLTAAYHAYQETRITEFPREQLIEGLEIFSALRQQEPERQGPFKLSYYADWEQMPALSHELQNFLQQRQIPWDLISSRDPFTHRALIDFLPHGISKAEALRWWSRSNQQDTESIVYAGDSGNDYAAFIAGFRTIIVGNADRELAEGVRQIHQQRGFLNRLHLATRPATSGVLEGCRAFGVIS